METWRQALAKSITKPEELAKHLDVDPDAIADVVAEYPMRITPMWMQLIKERGDAFWRQVVPEPEELTDDSPADDPLHEELDSPVPHLVHRYPDRVLFMVTNQCPIYCRFCTRKRLVGKPGFLKQGELDRVIEYLKAHTEVRDIILSGGDPLLLPDHLLERILQALRTVPHLEIIRIGTRVPGSLPERITPELCAMIKKYHPLYMNLHFNHPDELTPEVKAACGQLADAGVPLGAQTVLLKGVNDDPAVMLRLVHQLLLARVKPYYLYQADLTRGTNHLRTTVETGLEIIKALQGHTSGMGVPHFVIDAPGGGGKIPLLPSDYLVSLTPEQATLTNYEGKTYIYPQPPQPDGNGKRRELRRGAVLEKGHVYLIPLVEELALPRTLAGKTNSKSTTGRLDVFTRTITDFHARFDEIRPGYRGKLYLEVVPRSFSVRVAAGMCLNQLRLFSGSPSVSDAEIRRRHKTDRLLYRDVTPLLDRELRVDDGLFLRINLTGEKKIVGFRAKKNSQVLDLSRIRHYDPADFWEPLPRHRNETLLLEPEDFYILMSKERIRVPPDYAAEMVAYEAAVGEMRAHYAGFFDPGFGYGAGDLHGTPIVLEVRPHDVPFLIHDGQTFFKVLFERMQERPEKVYGEVAGSSYQFQGLTLSKQFKPYRG